MSGNNDVTRIAKSIRCDPNESGLENDISSNSRFGVNYSMYSQNPDLTSINHNVGIGLRSYPRVPSGIQPQLRNPNRSPSQIYPSPEGSLYVSPREHPSHRIIPNFEGEQPYNSFDAGQENLAQELTETEGCPFGSSMYPPPHHVLRTFNLPSPDYVKPDSFYDDKPNLSRRFTDTQVPSEGYTEAHQEVDNARGRRYFRLVPANYNRAEADFFSQVKPTTPSSRLQSDTFQRRASVFSRLEAPKEVCREDEVHDVDTGSSAEELRLLSHRRDQWNKSMESVNPMEFRTTLEHVFSGETLDYVISLITDTETFPLGKAPFLNFKRRSESRNVNDGAKESDHAEGDMGKCKRRKLMRPSFTDDDPFAQTKREHQEFQISSQEYVAVKATGIDVEDYRSKGSSALEVNSGFGEDFIMESARPVRVSTGTQIVVTDDRNSNSDGKEKDTPVSDTGARTSSVESGVECVKKLEEKG